MFHIPAHKDTRHPAGQAPYRPLYVEPTPDFTLWGWGTIYVLTPRSCEAHEWVKEHVSPDHQLIGAGIVIEHRYVEDIIDGIRGDGLSVEP